MIMHRHLSFLMAFSVLWIFNSNAMGTISADDAPLKNHVLQKLDGIIINATAINDIVYLYQMLTRMIKELDRVALEEEQGADTYQEFSRLLKEFEDSTLQFLHTARAVKKLMVQLIEEWAVLHDRPDTLLRAWTEMTTNNEHEFIREQVTSTPILHIFLSDLRSFLGDLVRSCPKGYNACARKR